MMSRHSTGRLPPTGMVKGVSQSTMRSMMDFVRARDVPAARGGREDAYGQIYRKVKSIQQGWVKCTSTVDAPPFSLLGVTDATYLSDDTIEYEVGFADVDSTVYAVNERYPLYADTPGWVRIVTPYDRYVVRSSPSLAFGMDDGVKAGDGGDVASCLLGELVALATSLNVGTARLTPIRENPVWSWPGVAAYDYAQNERLQVFIGDSTTEYRHVWTGMGSGSEGDLIWVGRNTIGLGSENAQTENNLKWWAVTRPCPDGLIS